MTEMNNLCKVPRPLSLSSDDLLREAEKTHAAKFVSRFPSSERIDSCQNNCNLKSASALTAACNSWSSPLNILDLVLQSPTSMQTPSDSTTLERSPDTVTPIGILHTENDLKSNLSSAPARSPETNFASSSLDPHGPLLIHDMVKLVISSWGPVEPISPERFFFKLLASRGYDCGTISALGSNYSRKPRPEQIQGYDIELVTAVRSSDLSKIRGLHGLGRNMSSCNKFSESIVHMACRRATFNVAEFVLSNGGDCNIVDDYGRTPLHDACWRMEPCFDIVTLLLDSNLELLRIVDIRGSTPLKYVREEHWVQWCAYFFHQKEKYWPILPEEARHYNPLIGL